jgi:hypothetical protein
VRRRSRRKMHLQMRRQHGGCPETWTLMMVDDGGYYLSCLFALKFLYRNVIGIAVYSTPRQRRWIRLPLAFHLSMLSAGCENWMRDCAPRRGHIVQTLQIRLCRRLS